MKKQTFYRLAVLAFLLCGGKLLVAAQPAQPLMTVQIPFEFQIKEKVMPAGRYVIKRDLHRQLLRIQCREQNASMIVFTDTIGLWQESSPARLIFREYEGKHFLAEVWSPELATKYELTMSKAESRLKHLAKARIIRLVPNDTQAKN